MSTSSKEISRPIRLIVGIGNNQVQGLGIVYESEDGSADFLNLWSDKVGLIRFVEGPSCIVWTATTTDVPGKGFGFFKTEPTIKATWSVKEIRVNRKLQAL